MPREDSPTNIDEPQNPFLGDRPGALAMLFRTRASSLLRGSGTASTVRTLKPSSSANRRPRVPGAGCPRVSTMHTRGMTLVECHYSRSARNTKGDPFWIRIARLVFGS